MPWPGLPLGGGKAVILADEDRTKTPDMLHAFGKAVDHLGGRYVTAEDVGMSVADMIEVAPLDQVRRRACPIRQAMSAAIPGRTLRSACSSGIKAAVKRALGKDSVDGLHIAMQGAGSVATGVALHACAEGARLSIADVDQAKAQKLADATGGTVVSPDEILTSRPTSSAPTRSARSSPSRRSPRFEGAGRRGRRQQPARDAARTASACTQRGILYAPDYVINAGGIINVCTEYLGDGDASLVRERIEGIPVRLEQIWAESAEQRPRSGRGRRRYGAAADRKGISRRAPCTRSPIRRASCAFASPATTWLLLIGLALAAGGHGRRA